MNGAQERKYLNQLRKMAIKSEKGMNAYKAAAWIFIVIGFLLASVPPFYRGYFSESLEYQSEFIFVGGLLIGFGFCFKISAQGWPLLVKHIDIKSIDLRLNELKS